jgi:hypothetical protein
VDELDASTRRLLGQRHFDAAGAGWQFGRAYETPGEDEAPWRIDHLAGAPDRLLHVLASIRVNDDPEPWMRDLLDGCATETSTPGRTKVAPRYKTRRRAATNEAPEAAPLRANPHRSAHSSRSW